MDLTASGVWFEEESAKHMNVLEVKAVSLALAAFLPQLSERSVVLMRDNASVVAYLRHQGGTVSRVLCLLASKIILWTEQHSICLSVRYIPGRKSILADQLGCPDQVLPTECSLLPRVFKGYLQCVRASPSQLLCHSSEHQASAVCVPGTGPAGLAVACLPTSVGPSVSAYAFLPFAPLRQVLSRVLASTGILLILVASLWPQKESFVDLPLLLVDEALELPQVWNLLVQLHMQKFHRDLAWRLSSISSERRAYRGRLRGSQFRTSNAPLQPYTSPSRPGSSVGVIDGVSIHARQLSLR